MSDLLHTHLTIGLRPMGECPACDQVHAVFASTEGQTEEGSGNPAHGKPQAA